MLRTLKAICFLTLVLTALALPSPSQAQVAVGVSIRIGPPALPVYPQPICPGPGYIWTPGYWSYGPAGYYWVPGTWVMPPTVGLLWTPGYWGWHEGAYIWHAGYWGHHVGFYGGVNYGFGYTGAGFVGGEWRGSTFHYNTAVTNVNTTIIHHTYHTTVINNTTVVNHVSYNGGPGGLSARPTSAERAFEHEHHMPATSLQTQHEHAARENRSFLASENHGHPEIGATSRPGAFKGNGEAPGHHDSFHEKSDRPPNKMNTPDHGAARSERPPNTHDGKPETSNSNYRPEAERQHENGHAPNPAHENGSHSNNGHSGTPHQSNEHSNGHQDEPHSGGHEGKPSH